MADKEKWTLKFEELTKDSVSQVGAKGANLAEMSRIGMPVPPGFVITTEAYDYFLKKTGTGQEINQLLNTLTEKPKGVAEVEALSQKLSQIMKTKDVPEELQEAICQAYEALSDKCCVANVPTAVRSSGIAEDLPTAAFAGQYESYLNVIGKDALIKKVMDCWCSLFTPRVISYQIRNNLPLMGKLMGVVVQKVVNPRCAGVIFTALPSTGDKSWIIIEGNWGTAESVVQGIVTPDKCYINKETLKLEEKHISCKLKQLTLAGGGTEERDIPTELQSIPCFSEKEATKLAELAIKVESHYGSPQDLEWVIDRDLPFPDNIFLVQTRPLTTLEKKSPTDQVLDLMLSRFAKRG
jgi:pyruvate,water dikinase